MLSKKEKQSEPETEVKNDTPKQEQPAPEQVQQGQQPVQQVSLALLQMELQDECQVLRGQMVLLKKILDR